MTVLLSSSSLTLFKDCPRCFWLYKVKKIRRPSGPFPSLPSGMDKILKVHFDKHRKKGTLPAVMEGKYKGKLYPDLEKMTIWRSNFKGLRFTKGEFTLMGALDELLLTSEGKYAPVDYKTRGYPLKEDTHEHYQDQMSIYSFLLEKNEMPTTGYAVLLFYHPLKVNREHHVEFQADPIKIKTDAKAALRLFDSASKILENDEPKPSKDCGFCKWNGF